MRHTASRLDKVEGAMPASPSMSSSLSDAPVILESPTSTTGYRQMPTKLATPPAMQPTRRRLHRRRRREPHLNHHLTDRLDMLARYLPRAPKSDYQEALHAQTQRAIDDLLDNIHSFFFLYEAEKRPLWRLAQTGRLVQQVESLHRTLDAITARCGLAVVAPSGSGPSLPRWQARWRRMRAERLVFFRSYLEDHEAVAASNSRIREPTDQLELLTLLKHDAQKFDTVLTADELELLERTFTFVAGCCNSSMDFETQLRMMSLPEWFVAPYERTKQQLKWQRAAVTVRKAPRSMNPGECFKLASTWSRLKNPHIMNLFGACHVGRRRFFVVAEGTPLTRCLGDHGFPLWRALHEAALALQYLHERRVGLTALSCADLILFRSGDRDAVMLAGFNLTQMTSALESSAIFGRKTAQEEEDPLLEDDESDSGYDDVDMIHREHDAPSRMRTLRDESCVGTTKKYWQAPELTNRVALGPTETADIFMLGMCVVEAFSGGNVWGESAGSYQNQDGYHSADVGTQSSKKWMPPRPAALDGAWQWALVERMCSLDPKQRPPLTEVLASFQVFAEDEEKANTDFASTKRRKKPRHHSLRQAQPRATLASIVCALSEVQAWCDEASESSALNYQLYERMDDIAARLEAVETGEAASHLPVLSALILRFRDFLQRHVNESLLLRLAATRQIIELSVELHGELDVLMDRLRFHRSGASIHSWRSQQSPYREQLWKRMRLSLAMDVQTLSGELDGEQELALLGALLAFEANKRRTSYATQDLELLETALVKVEETYQTMTLGPTPDFRNTESKSMLELPPWFVPPYEVVFNELGAFSRGAFGSVHFGKWVNRDVVVKKMLPSEEPGVVIPLLSRRGAEPNANKPAGDQYKRFLNEMSAWSGLKHPNVLKLFGACHVGQHQFFVCEYATQGTIDCFVASKPAEERGVFARRMLHDIALGLHYLHTQNIVHADLRCSNILVDAQGVAKLTDFGFSSLKNKRRPDEATIDSDNLAGGVSRWVAPECLDGETPTFASNVYAFAMCAIEVVSGELPWGCEMSDATVRCKVRKGLLPPRPVSGFSDSEWSLIERMCCHDPKVRMTSSDVVTLLT
ncbi:Serine active site containing protein 1 [Phytophthora pseudosyringae]|uniref:Serine active site containing protein 1 n=1 Tax=Phytophthora pseudosyringae TaxID=221518 RepID=A0A8T1VR64_9STRA|nr:Serine active site containing protein 1 [Phytophthora pseudosyringae]